jgi:Asp/Glu/hydantoin racemase
MIYQTQAGRASSGEAIGILLLDTSVPFIPGDVANATTYAYPVRFRKVPGYTVARAIGKDPSIYEALENAAAELVGQGVRAVTGDCGFMALHQQRLAAALDVPVFLSSLLQIPFICAILGGSARLGVITADSRSLDDELLAATGVSDPDRIVIAGLQDYREFYRFAIQESGTLDPSAVEAEVVAAAEKLVRENDSVKALLLECSLLPPYAAAVQAAVNLPVFDYVTMVDYVFNAVVRRRYSGFV